MKARVVGTKARMIVQSRGGGEHEPGIGPGDEVVGHEMIDFNNTCTIRTGDEPTIQAPRGARCGGITHSHNVKTGSPMRDMGPKDKGMGNALMCPQHYGNLQTLDSLLLVYQQSFYGTVQITNPETGEILFNKEPSS